MLRILLRSADYRAFMVGQASSAVGDALSLIVLPLLALKETGSGLSMGLVGMSQALAVLVSAPLAGVVADRFPRRRVMLVCDVLRALVVSAIPLAVVLSLPLLPVVYVTVVLQGVLFSFFEAACLSCVPSLVGPEAVGPANSYLLAANTIGYLIGTGLAGPLVAAVGPGTAMGVDAASYALSALSLALIRNPLSPPGPREPRSPWSELRGGLAFLRTRPVLQLLALLTFLGAVLEAPLVPVVIYQFQQEYGFSPSMMSGVLVVYTVGGVLGSVATAWVPSARYGTAVLGANLLSGLLLIPVAFTRAPLALSLCLVLVGSLASIATASSLTLRVRETPDALLGRVNSSLVLLSFSARPVGLLLGGFVLEWAGGTSALVTLALCVVLLNASLLPTSLAAPRPAPETAPSGS